MFDLFRFVMLRPAEMREPHEILATAADTELQRQLERDRERHSPGGPMQETSDAFLKTEGAVSSISSLSYTEGYDTLAGSLRAAIPANRAALLTEIRNAFGRSAGDLIQDQGFFREDRERLADTLIAAKLGTPRIGLPLELIARNLRLTALIQRAAASDARLDTPDGIRAALDVSITLPDKLLPIEQPLVPPTPEGGGRPPGERPSASPQENRARQRELALREYQELSEAHDYLRDLPAELVHDAGSQHSTAGGLTGDAGLSASDRPPPVQHGDIGDMIFREVRELRTAVLATRTSAERGAPELVAAGLPLSSDRVLQGTTLKIRREALAAAPQAVHGGLRAARVDLAKTSLSDAVDRINARRRELAPLVVDELIGASRGSESNVSLVGGQFVSMSDVADLTAERRDNG